MGTLGRSRTLTPSSRAGAPRLGLLLCILCAVFMWAAPLLAGSVRLYNDSPYVLKAVVHSNSGIYLGETIVVPGNVATWNDSNFSQPGYEQQSNVSQTPYTVLWYCLTGGSYSVCYQVPSAQTVSAQACNGPRQCKSGTDGRDFPCPAKPQGGSYLQPPNENQGQCCPCEKGAPAAGASGGASPVAPVAP
jgi:hypothetical protein